MSHSINLLNRRNFLYFIKGLGITLVLDSVFGKTQALEDLTQTDSQVSYPDTIDLHVRQTTLEIAGKNANALTVNNSIPGPLLRLKEGKTATIQVTNHLKQDTSIHWHGIILPANMDGVPGLSFAGIKPGQTFTYRFPVNQSGTYWYHSHSGLQEQQGHFGALIIDPIEPDPFEYQRDYVVMLSDWTFENPHQILANLKKVGHYYNYQKRTAGNLFEDLPWLRMRMDPTDIADVTGATYTYLMNGITSESNWTGLFKPGEKVRLRFINSSAMTYFDVQIPGLKMTVVQADGQNIQPVTVDEFRIAVAETYDVIVEPQENIAYTIFAETMDRSGYTRGTLAPQQGMIAAIPQRRPRPLRTMADMGHGHGGHDNGHSEHNMPEHNMPEHNMPGHNMPGHNMPEHQDLPNSHNNHRLEEPIMLGSRLHEPGIGLENTDTHRVLVYTDLRSVKPTYNQRQIDREIELHLTGNMERYMWSFDGKKYSESPEITFYYGERLRLTFINDTMMEHPIHLHGMWMELDNGSGEYKPRKHIVNVKPAERCSVEVTVDVHGKWAFHCHLLYHMKAGMFRTIAVVDRAVEVNS